MKVGIVGTRRLSVAQGLDIEAFIDTLPKGTVIVTGGANGADTVAETYGKSKGFEVKVILPDADALAKAYTYWQVVQVYYDRNKKIVEAVDELHAWPHPNRKGGTENTIKWAGRLRKPVTRHEAT